MYALIVALLLANGSGSAKASGGAHSPRPTYLNADFMSSVVLNNARLSAVPSRGGSFVALNWTQLSPVLGAGGATLSVTVNGVAVCSMRIPCAAAGPVDYRCPALGDTECPASSVCDVADFSAGDDIDVKFTASACTLGALPGGVASIEISQ